MSSFLSLNLADLWTGRPAPAAVSAPVAVAALLIELAECGAEPEEDRHDRIRAALVEIFGLGPWEVQGVLREAEAAQWQSVDSYRFTHAIKTELDREQRWPILRALARELEEGGTRTAVKTATLARIAALLGFTQDEVVGERLAVRDAHAH
ncbi:TerB family tellurite resistance protein [Salinarimonas soli]|uniref:Co-chaperone DjlA N-terminal domain-containing protein n=1 Tax=Salinarimonas soli TaxID=1638099 RepID=A0A5B2VC83_9HYPH|nr:TerB family tellurite resistance protein [Salinarimonas soli]KAA2236325.1 hypothetical protein F0L46_16625 [Salinarimonas soli]